MNKQTGGHMNYLYLVQMMPLHFSCTFNLDFYPMCCISPSQNNQTDRRMNGLLYRDYFLEKSMQHSLPVIQPDRQTDCLPVFLPAPWDKITSYIHSFTLEITIHSFCVWIYLYTYIPLGLLCVVLYSHPNETIPCPIYQPTNELWKKLTFEIWFFGLACIGV